jgi:hypothetical protein
MRRYSRSGYASRWFLAALAAGFAGLAAWGLVRGDWLVLALAGLMTLVTLAAVPLTRRLADALRESTSVVETQRGDRHG